MTRAGENTHLNACHTKADGALSIILLLLSWSDQEMGLVGSLRETVHHTWSAGRQQFLHSLNKHLTILSAKDCGWVRVVEREAWVQEWVEVEGDGKGLPRRLS